MPRLLAFTIIWASWAVGITVGLTICVAIGYFIGSLFNASTSGMLCGLVWWGFGYALSINELADNNAERIDALTNLQA
jgi:hypothetical protein